MPLIALLTDFGTRDWFVASTKAVILEISPDARIVDITHEIAPGDIRSAAFVLRTCFRDFPEGTIFVTVVDPGVGSERRGIAVRTDRYRFVGPDNGIISPSLALDGKPEVRFLTNERFFRQPVSSTFHGRDVFGPVAGHIANGTRLSSFGPRVTEYYTLAIPACTVAGHEISGEILYIDRFGNAITNITDDACAAIRGKTLQVTVNNHVVPLVGFYNSVDCGKALGIIGSAHALEISVNGGTAAQVLGLKIGDPVTVREHTPVRHKKTE